MTFNKLSRQIVTNVHLGICFHSLIADETVAVEHISCSLLFAMGQSLPSTAHVPEGPAAHTQLRVG